MRGSAAAPAATLPARQAPSPKARHLEGSIRFVMAKNWAPISALKDSDMPAKVAKVTHTA